MTWRIMNLGSEAHDVHDKVRNHCGRKWFLAFTVRDRP